MAKSNETIKVKLSEDESNVAGSMSWKGFERTLKDSGLLRQYESLTSVSVTKEGIVYYIAKD